MTKVKHAKRKGTRRERDAKKILEGFGYYCIRSTASLGLFDLVAVNKNEIVLIQVKVNNPPSKQEMDRIKKFKDCPANARKEIWVMKDYQRQPQVFQV